MKPEARTLSVLRWVLGSSRQKVSVEVTAKLRGEGDYSFNWVVSKGKIIERLEEVLHTIADQGKKHTEHIAEIKGFIGAAQKKLANLTSEIPELRDKVAEMEDRKAVLEAELDFSGID